MKKRLLFDYYERMVIIDFYKKPLGGFASTPLVITRFEITRAKREFQKEIDKLAFNLYNFLCGIFKIKKMTSFKPKKINIEIPEIPTDKDLELRVIEKTQEKLKQPLFSL